MDVFIKVERRKAAIVEQLLMADNEYLKSLVHQAHFHRDKRRFR